MTTVHQQIEAADMFILFERVGPEVMICSKAKDCANAIVVHPTPERLMVRGLAHGREVFRMTALDFGMTIFD